LQNQEDQLELVLRLGQAYDNGVLAVAELGSDQPATFVLETRVPDVSTDAVSRHRQTGQTAAPVHIEIDRDIQNNGPKRPDLDPYFGG
jgi:hypothetical protein